MKVSHALNMLAILDQAHRHWVFATKPGEFCGKELLPNHGRTIRGTSLGTLIATDSGQAISNEVDVALPLTSTPMPTNKGPRHSSGLAIALRGASVNNGGKRAATHGARA